MKYWEIEFECDNSWSVSGRYSFFMRQLNKPTAEDFERVYGIRQNEGGFGNVIGVYDITNDLQYYESIPDEWYEEWLASKKDTIQKSDVRKRIALLERNIREQKQSVIAEMDKLRGGCATLEMVDVLLNSKEYLKLSTRLATLNDVLMDIVDMRCDEMFEDN